MLLEDLVIEMAKILAISETELIRLLVDEYEDRSDKARDELHDAFFILTLPNLRNAHDNK